MSLNIPVHYSLSDSTLSMLFRTWKLEKKTSTDDDEYESDVPIFLKIYSNLDNIYSFIDDETRIARPELPA